MGYSTWVILWDYLRTTKLNSSILSAVCSNFPRINSSGPHVLCPTARVVYLRCKTTPRRK